MGARSEVVELEAGPDFEAWLRTSLASMFTEATSLTMHPIRYFDCDKSSRSKVVFPAMRAYGQIIHPVSTAALEFSTTKAAETGTHQIRDIDSIFHRPYAIRERRMRQLSRYGEPHVQVNLSDQTQQKPHPSPGIH